MKRANEIRKLVEDSGFMSVNELATTLDLNVSTIRRDLEEMAQQGLLRRTHGGAVPAQRAERAEQAVANLPEKRAIGSAMAERVLEGQTVFIGAGTTCIQVARALRHERVTVVTHDLLVAMEVLRKPALNLLFIGGELLPGRTHMWGPGAVEQLNQIRVNVAVFGASSVLEDGIYGNSAYILEIDRKIRTIASEAFFVADSTKFGRPAMYKILGIEDFTAGITDSLLEPIKVATYPIPLIRAGYEPQ